MTLLAQFAATGGGAANYIEDCFQTWLYTGNGATQTITNGIDLSTKGGLTWIKQRSATRDNLLFDTVRGATQRLFSNLTSAQSVDASSLTAFNSTGFSIGSDSGVNINAGTYASWTFREQAKFFDIVTYTGDGTQGRSVSHNLGSAPGFMIVKRINGVDNWRTYHRSLGGTKYMSLDTTAAAGTANTLWNDADPTSTVFYLGNDNSVNASGGTYIAYLFAHNAGGFGLTGTDNVISCGSYTGNGSATGPVVTLGYEPQWVLIKSSTVAGSDWYLMDNMRGMAYTQCNELYPNLSVAEVVQSKTIIPTATGFNVATTDAYINNNGSTYIYIACRRGPMKVPTTGTSVFATQVYSSGSSPAFSGVSFPPDSVIQLYKAGGSATTGQVFGSKLQGPVLLKASSTSAETSEPDFVFYQNGFRAGSATTDYAAEMFRRAPSFMDVVCYTGNNTARTLNHNLGAVPELMIIKNREQATDWIVYSATLGATKNIRLNTTAAEATNAIYFNSTAPTSTVFSVGADGDVNNSTRGYVTYLFATCAGVSKVGSYTGTAATQTINCGFTAGSRFVMIKRTDSTGDWYVWDSARGIIAGNDPYLLLNSTAAEVTGTDYVDTANSGFELSSTAPAAINANGGTYIFLAIA
jgi:hypothetical protein